MRADEKLTFYEGAALLTLTFLYHVFNEVLPTLVVTTGTSSWISQIIAAVLSLGFLGLFLLLFRMHQGMDFLQISDAVYGPVFSKIIHIVIWAYLLFYTAVCLNQAVELLQIYAYSEISALEIDLIMMLAVCIFALYSIKGMAKTVSIVLPLIYAIMVFILLMCYSQYDVKLLNPVLGYGVQPTLVSGFYLLSVYNGLFVLAIFMPAFGKAKDFKKSSIWAIGAGGLLTIATTICYNMAVPYRCVQDLMVGILGVAQSNRNGRFIQRQESIFIAATVMAIALLMGIGFLAAKKVYCNIFHLNKPQSKMTIIPQALIITCMGRTMGNFQSFKDTARVFTRRYGILLTLGLLVLTLLVSWLRKKAGGGKGVKAAAVLLVPCLVMGTFSGCVHYREPDAEIYPIIMGYDKGEHEKYKITMKFMLDSTGGAEQQEQESSGNAGIPKDTVVMEAPSFTEGINLMTSLIPKKVSLLHIKVLVISEELAREGVDDFVAPLIRYNEIRPSMGFVVCRDSAYEFIASENAILTDSLQVDMELVLSTDKESTAYYVVSLSEFLYNYKGSYGDAVAIYGAVNQGNYQDNPEDESDKGSRVGDAPLDFMRGYYPGELPIAANNEMELAGMAVFRYDKMVGALNTREVALLMFLNNTLNTTSFSIPDPHNQEDYVSIQVRRITPTQVSSWIDDEGKAHVDITTILNGSIGISQNPKIHYADDAARRRELNDYVNQKATERSAALVHKLQSEFGSDALQLGRHVAKNFSTIQEWEDYNWSEQYKEADIRITLQFNL